MSEDAKEIGCMALLVAFFFSFGCLVGCHVGVRMEYQRAIKAGAGAWSVNPETGETRFEYRGGEK